MQRSKAKSGEETEDGEQIKVATCFPVAEQRERESGEEMNLSTTKPALVCHRHLGAGNKERRRRRRAK